MEDCFVQSMKWVDFVIDFDIELNFEIITKHIANTEK